MSVSFTEVMSGEVTLAGGDTPAPCKFELTITVDDVDAHFDDPAHRGSATGEIDCDLFGGTRPVAAGEFKLFDTVDDPKRRAMRYRLPFADKGGNPCELVGMKDVGDDPGLDLWADTTTLATQIRSGHDTGIYESPSAPILADGVLTIAIDDFIEQLSTFRGNPIEIAKFVWRFNQTLGSVYL